MTLKSSLIFLFCITAQLAFSQDFNLFLQNNEEQRLMGDNAFNGIKIDGNHLIKLKEVRDIDDKGKLLCGRVVLRNFLQQKGANLLASSYPEIELILLGTNGLDLEKEIDKMMDTEVEKRKKKGLIKEEEQKEIDHARKFLKDMFSLKDNRSDYAVAFQLNKEPEIFFRFTIYNGEDKVISNGHSSFMNIYQVHLLERPTEQCYIEIVMENENSVKKLKSKMEDIVLP